MRVLLLAAPFLLAGCLSDPTFVNETVDVTENLTLTTDVLKTKYRLDTPNVVFDGQGMTINGDCNTDCVGISITGDNVVVRNLTIRGFDGGVSLRNGASNVIFENVTITDNVQHGIFVDTASNNFVCRNCTISDNGSIGIYLEYNTFGGIIENSEISFNGFRDKDTGDFFENQANKRRDKREGVAVDSSQHNVIRNTDFFGNALAGVSLYRNCGERGIPRDLGANFNRIEGGVFSDDIVIASRADKNLSDFDCLRPYILSGKFVMDDAEFNEIVNVRLEGNTRIVIQDDNNVVTGVNGGQVVTGSSVRDAIMQPVTGIDIRNITSAYVGDPSFLVE